MTEEEKALAAERIKKLSDPTFSKQMMGIPTFSDSGREGTPSEGMDSMTGAPIRKAVDSYQKGNGLMDSLKAGASQFGNDPRDVAQWPEMVHEAGIENPYLGAGLSTAAQFLEPKIPMAGVSGTVGKYIGGKGPAATEEMALRALKVGKDKAVEDNMKSLGKVVIQDDAVPKYGKVYKNLEDLIKKK
jgi:hypothetical protein